MVRYANGSGTAVSAFSVSTSCATHHFPAGSLHAPYGLPSLPAVGKVMTKAALEQAAEVDGEGEGVAAMLSKWQGRFAGRTLASSVDLIREDRSR
ncbi:MAG: hypothetical protein WCJ35_02685 [Planctomycetota bacterium]